MRAEREGKGKGRGSKGEKKGTVGAGGEGKGKRHCVRRTWSVKDYGIKCRREIETSRHFLLTLH